MSAPAVLCAVRDVADDAHVAREGAALAGDLDLPVALAHVRSSSAAVLAAATRAAAAGGVLPPAIPPDVLIPTGVAPDGLDDLARELDPRGARVATEVLEGDTAGALLASARRPTASWLVVGGPRRSHHLPTLGATLRRLVDGAGCPLLVVPRARDRPPRVTGTPVTCIVDDDERALATVDLAATVARARDTGVLLVHPCAPRGSAAWKDRATRTLMQRWAEAVAAHGVPVRLRLTPARTADTLLTTAHAAGTQLVVLGNAAGRRTRVTLAYRLAARSRVPVAVVRQPRPDPAPPLGCGDGEGPHRPAPTAPHA